MRIESLDVQDDDAVVRLTALLEAVRAHDTPDRAAVDLDVQRAFLRTPRPFSAFEHWTVNVAGAPVAYAEIMYTERENTHLATLLLKVHPEHRRRGIGTALYRHCESRAKAAGRTAVFAAATGPAPGSTAGDGPGVVFLEKMGLSRALVEVRRRLGVTTVDEAAHAAMLADARAHTDGYELVSWRDRAPDELVDGLAALEGRLLMDAPTGDLDMEPEKYDAERWRRMEERTVGAKRTFYYTAAVHAATGFVAASTGMLFRLRPRDIGSQQTTIVDPDHRGRRLGVLVKLANLAYVRANEPELRFVDTYNAEDNTHMNAINDALGFVACDMHVEFQGPVR